MVYIIQHYLRLESILQSQRLRVRLSESTDCTEYYHFNTNTTHRNNNNTHRVLTTLMNRQVKASRSSSRSISDSLLLNSAHSKKSRSYNHNHNHNHNNTHSTSMIPENLCSVLVTPLCGELVLISDVTSDQPINNHQRRHPLLIYHRCGIN